LGITDLNTPKNPKSCEQYIYVLNLMRFGGESVQRVISKKPH